MNVYLFTKKLSFVVLSTIMVFANGVFSFPFGESRLSQAVAADNASHRLTGRNRQLLEAALQVAEKQDSNYAKVIDFISISNKYWNLGEIDKAKELLNKAVEIRDDNNITLRDLRISRGYIAVGEWEKADHTFQQIIETARSKRQELPLGSIAALYGQFPNPALIQERLSTMVGLVPAQIEHPRDQDGFLLRGLAVAYRRLDDSAFARSGMAHLLELAESQLLSVYPKSVSTEQFFDHEATFFELTESEIAQSGGPAFTHMLSTYARFFYDIALIYESQGDRRAAQKNIEKALTLRGILELKGSNNIQGNITDILSLIDIALASEKLGDTALAQKLLSKAEAKNQLEEDSNYRIFNYDIARAYHQIGDDQNAQRILNDMLNHIHTSVTQEKSPLGKQNAYRLIHGLARAYANIGDVDKQQSLLKETFDALFAIDLSKKDTDFSSAKKQIFEDATNIYTQISDNNLADQQLSRLEEFITDQDWQSLLLFNLSDLSVAAAQRGSVRDAERLALKTLEIAQTHPSLDIAHVIASADAISHLEDPQVMRFGLETIQMMSETSLYDVDRLYGRLVDTYLDAVPSSSIEKNLGADDFIIIR